ncbi:hypothetical protein ACTI_69870 [Actinoplanes sp. OR16]|nr:hypothetical protein ACTI_69870 [Actinoplanes sp. OR16]
MALIGLLAAACLAATVVIAADGDVAGALIPLFLTLWFGHVAVAVRMLRRPVRGTVRPRLEAIDDGSVGLTFRYRTAAYYWLAAALVLTAAAIALFAVAMRSAGWGYTVVFLLLAAITLSPLTVMFRRPPGRLTLTPGGVHHHGFAFTCFTPWPVVTGVGAAVLAEAPALIVEAGPSPETRVIHALPRLLAGWEQRLFPLVVVQTPLLGSDPVIVYRTVCHYLANPYHRVELSTPAAIDRVRQQRFLLPR